MYEIKKYTVENGNHVLWIDTDDITEILEVKFISHDGSISDPVDYIEIPGDTPSDVYYEFTYPTVGVGVNAAMIIDSLNTYTYTIVDLTSLVTCLVDKTLHEDFDHALQIKIRAIEMYVINSEPGLAAEVFNSASRTCRICTTGEQPTEIKYNIHILNNTYTIN
jgi:hypothetical protein